MKYLRYLYLSIFLFLFLIFVPSTHASAGSDTLYTNETLAAGQSLISSNQQYTLVMQSDGNLVEYGNGCVMWNQQTQGNNPRLVMQSDGNLVEYNSTGLWATYTSGSNNRLVIQNDGNLVIYTSSSVAVWQNGSPKSDRLCTGGILRDGQYIHSSNGYNLWMQTAGNLVLYNPDGTPRWWTSTSGSNNWLSMQNDGNLVLYSSSNAPLWNSVTGGLGTGIYAVAQNDGNFVIRAGDGTPLSSNGELLVVTWAKGQIPSTSWDQKCLQFVATSWAAEGVDIGSATTALDYWNTNPKNYVKHAESSYGIIPQGALVFWGSTQYNSDGHVAISLGDGRVVSTPAYPYGNPSNAVFIFSLSQRPANTYNYLGWMMP